MAELTVLVPLGDREIEMRKPSDGSLVVLARITRALPNDKIENDSLSDEARDKLIRNLGTVGRVIEQMIVKEDDLDWLDDVMISGTVTTIDVFDSIRVAGEKFNGPNAAAGPAVKAPVRRRR